MLKYRKSFTFVLIIISAILFTFLSIKNVEAQDNLVTLCRYEINNKAARYKFYIRYNYTKNNYRYSYYPYYGEDNFKNDRYSQTDFMIYDGNLENYIDNSLEYSKTTINNIKSKAKCPENFYFNTYTKMTCLGKDYCANRISKEYTIQPKLKYNISGKEKDKYLAEDKTEDKKVDNTYACKYSGFDGDNDPITFYIQYRVKNTKSQWHVSYYYKNAEKDASNSYGDVAKDIVFKTCDKGNSFYMHKETENKLINEGKCPLYLYADTDAGNEFCFDNGKYCVQNCDAFEEGDRVTLEEKGTLGNNSAEIKKALTDYVGNKNITSLSDIDKCTYVKGKAKQIIAAANDELSDNDKMCDYDFLCNVASVMKFKNATIGKFKQIIGKNAYNQAAYADGLDELSTRFQTSLRKFCDEVCEKQNSQQAIEVCEDIDKIFEETAEATKKLKKITLPTVTLKNKSEATCDSILGSRNSDGFVKNSFGWLLQKVFNIFKIIAPLLVLGLTIFEFAKAIISQDQDALKKASNLFIKRLIIMAVLFFLPTIIWILLDILGQNTGTCNLK